MSDITIKQKLINYYYFVIFNSILACIIGIGYWSTNSSCAFIAYPNISDWLAYLYIFCMHCLMLTTISYIFGLLISPVIFIKNNKNYAIQLILYFIYITILLLDIIIFHADSIHLFDVDLSQLENAITDISIMLTRNKIIALVCWFFLGIIVFLTRHKFIFLKPLQDWKLGLKFNKSIATLAIIAGCIFFISGNERQSQLTYYIQRLPLCYKTDSNLVNKLQQTTTKIVNGKINYPLSVLKTQEVVNPPNILIIGIDAWKHNYFNANFSPNLWQFAKQGKIFFNHRSGSNRTIGGIFSLFYSMPLSYWNSMLDANKTPILFTRLAELNYQIGIFTASGTPLPKFINHRELLSNGAKLDLSIIANTSSKKDEIATNNLLAWHKSIDKSKPWFAFVFYECAHKNDFPDWFSKDYSPHTADMRFKDIVEKYGEKYFIESYGLAVAYDDFLAGKILQYLEQHNDLSNTIVIITSDHGKEMNETGQFQWGFATNFTDFQIKVPFAIVGPNIDYNKLNWNTNDITTHYDIMPTILKNFLGIENKLSDYSIGLDLLEGKKNRDYSIVASFSYYSANYGIVSKKSALRWFRSGKYWFTDFMNRFLAKPAINDKTLNQAIEQMTRFLK